MLLHRFRQGVSQLRPYRRLLLRSTVFFLFVWPCILYVVLAYLTPSTPNLQPASLYFSERPLVVVAHPDDESLFFGPALLSLTGSPRRKAVTVLVLSSGNNYGLGQTRKGEMKGACQLLKANDCIVINQKDLQDNPHEWWPEDAISAVVERLTVQLKTDVVLTFDTRGISGHINHRAVSSALVHMASSKSTFPPVYLLRTVSTLLPPRKYIGILDLPLTSLKFTFRILDAFFSSEVPLAAAGNSKAHLISRWRRTNDKGLYVSSWATWVQNVRAFWAHGSQNSWDRVLYIFLSRYMWVNDVFRVYPEKKERTN